LGGAAGTGGVTGTGGAGVACPTAFSVNSGGFVTMPASGGACWHGYAYTFHDALGTTTTSPTTFAGCGSPCSLAVTGTIGASTAANSYGTYAGVGFALNQDVGGTGTSGTVSPHGTGLTVTFDNAFSTAGLQVVLSDGTNNWCSIVVSSPATILYSAFNTKCYDTPVDGTAYAKQPITGIQLDVPGGAVSMVYGLSLIKVVENQ
jgi:hypothetical protein